MGLMTSCYKMLSTHAPEKVETGETFEVSFTVVDDGSSVQNFVTDWSYAGVRVPEGWTVTVPTGAHRQYAESWVYYEDGSKVSSSHSMKACDKLTAFYNEACPKKGYQWHAFQTTKQVPKNISACWRNGCDSISITFLVTVPDGTPAGKYQIDFIGGDEEDSKGVDKYASAAEAKGSRLFHVGTVSSSYVENKSTALSRTIEVLDKQDRVHASGSTSGREEMYDISGRKLTSTPASGLIIQNGKKRLISKHH